MLSILLPLWLFWQPPLEEYQAIITINNLRFEEGGSLKIQVFDQAILADDELVPVLEKVLDISDDCLPVVLDGLPSGDYLIAVFHDVNENGKMDYSFFGSPREGYGFSGDFSCTKKSRSPQSHLVKLQQDLQHFDMELCYAGAEQ